MWTNHNNCLAYLGQNWVTISLWPYVGGWYRRCCKVVHQDNYLHRLWCFCWCFCQWQLAQGISIGMLLPCLVPECGRCVCNNPSLDPTWCHWGYCLGLLCCAMVLGIHWTPQVFTGVHESLLVSMGMHWSPQVSSCLHWCTKLSTCCHPIY